MWVIPPHQNAAFVWAMERVLDVYQRPYDPARPVVCVDESPKRLLRDCSARAVSRYACPMAAYATTASITAKASPRSHRV